MTDEPNVEVLGITEDELRKLYAALGDNIDAREILWKLEQGSRGVWMANNDLHETMKIAAPREPYVEHLLFWLKRTVEAWGQGKRDGWAVHIDDVTKAYEMVMEFKK